MIPIITARDLTVILMALERLLKHARNEGSRQAVEDAIANVTRLSRERASERVASVRYRASDKYRARTRNCVDCQTSIYFSSTRCTACAAHERARRVAS